MKNEAQVWDLQSRHALCKPLDHPGHFYGIFNICFSQDGRYLLTGAKDGQTTLGLESREAGVPISAARW